ncbi:MAG: aminotransferase class III-fold pyridoxal phosphate-dependent enzyme [Gammaproteobacteria bacterium]|nr:aminotransferase class III-fold pyridoxal phosphate-dependent enzyme [Gammaproteobacteria bacterium]
MTDLLDSLCVEPPVVSLAEARFIAENAFHLIGSFSELGGERDRNFLIKTKDADVVLKIANTSERDEILDMQCEALSHIRRFSPMSPTPSVRKTIQGAYWATFLSENGETLRARVFTWMPGDLVDQGIVNGRLMSNLGKTVAKLNLALRGFFHPAARHPLAWDTQNFDQLSVLIRHIESPLERDMVQWSLDRFQRLVKPKLPNCRSQLIHNDISFHNAVVSPDDPGQIAGIFDFGDMVYGPIVQDLANSAAEWPAGSSAPLKLAVQIIKGFHSVLPLEDSEMVLLPDLMSARLAACLLLEAWADDENPWSDARDHLQGLHLKIMSMLKALYDAQPGELEMMIREACDLPFSLPSSKRKPTFAVDKQASWKRRQKYLGNAGYFAYSDPLHISHSDGVWLYDVDGKPYLDVYNNVPHVGHCHPEVVEAISNQTATLNTNTRYVYNEVNEYAERLIEMLPAELDTCYFVSSGSEANDLAWRLATDWTGHDGALVMDNAYHGVTDITYRFSHSETRRAKKHFPEIETVPVPDDYRGHWKREDSSRGKRYAQMAADSIHRLNTTGHQPALFMLDSIMSSSGIFTPPLGYLDTLYDIVRKAGGLCVADEVQSGFGRTGKHMWGFEFGNVVPDIVTFGKPIAGGYPMGLVVTRREIADKFEKHGEFFSTTGGNPVACAAALAILRVMKNEKLMANADTMGEKIKYGLSSLAQKYPLIGDVRGSGLFIGVELVLDRMTLVPATDRAREIANQLRQRGVLIGVDGVHQNVLKIRPPMVFNESHVDFLLTELERALGQ